jgi:flagellar protein FliO/FliZ
MFVGDTPASPEGRTETNMEMITPYLNWIYLASVVLALLLFAWIMVRAFGGKVRARKGARLGISEYYEVDKSRFLVLVRRDDVEHLVLVGGNQDLVIEAGIRPDAPAMAANQGRRIITAEDLDHLPDMPGGQPADLAAEPHSNVRPMPQRQAPRPPVFGDQPASGEPPLRAVKPELD